MPPSAATGGMVMSECHCCSHARGNHDASVSARCPACAARGFGVGLVTLKSLLLPQALAKLNSTVSYYMCPNKACHVVYFDDSGQIYKTTDLKVPVFQKSDDEDCPVCYCFGWTRRRIKREIDETGTSTAIADISAHVKAGRCACEVNNPQGSCCLANVASVISAHLAR